MSVDEFKIIARIAAVVVSDQLKDMSSYNIVDRLSDVVQSDFDHQRST